MEALRKVRDSVNMLRAMGATPRYLYCSQEMATQLKQEVCDGLLRTNAEAPPSGCFWLFGMLVCVCPECKGDTIVLMSDTYDIVS